MKELEVTYLLGSKAEIAACPVKPYDSKICDFLDVLSRELRLDAKAREYPDIMSFSFWCRRGNIQKLCNSYNQQEWRIGRGVVFHIAPSNVPINFAFSLVFGLLSGNSNIVRVSAKEFVQVHIVCACLKRILALPEFESVKKMVQIISYDHDQRITDYYSELCDARVIWGGDSTIKEIRKSPIRPRTVEIVFADRYSIALFNSDVVASMGDLDLKRLAEGFYNDTYLMDQNACSSPHLVFWKTSSEVNFAKAAERFWGALYEESQRYGLDDKKVSCKYTDLCECMAVLNGIKNIKRLGNRLYVLSLQELPEDITVMRGRFGMFFEYHISDIDELMPLINKKIQTCICCGMDKDEVRKSVVAHHVLGIDRVVETGTSLDIQTIWDGYDVIGYLSRIVG